MADPAQRRRVSLKRPRVAGFRSKTTTSAQGWPPLAAELAAVGRQLSTSGFVRVDQATLRAILTPPLLADWASFAASWNDLGIDRYMADRGRYRRRRFAAFLVSSDNIVREPDRPHFQSRVHNPLNGGIERWFDPVLARIGNHPVTYAMLRMGGNLFSSLSPDRAAASKWHAEMHQFRISAKLRPSAQPTPEGIHRDGVDWVIVILIDRQNVHDGATRIVGMNDQLLDEFTLTRPQEALFLNDRRVRHVVTPIWTSDAIEGGFRDVLVLTFRAERARQF